ncbi:ABC transporter ATP-binding protein [Helicobacter burdigaliensis]|uniref:ABC transporter ATP-binding protein n=1 Tax=Helicobacter burdigaliensis TaxID=2315334 RepID=UPI000EF6D248|nr:ATP-binding cassette domain-containing protein [Helicobacter burdigaliensis]
MPPLLYAKELCFNYDVPILNKVDLIGEEKQIISIMGVSGSGKSTLLHILSSFLKPQSGEVKLFGTNPYSLSQKNLLELRRKQIGIIFQSHYLFLGFSAYENLEVASILGKEKIDDTLLEHFGIANVLNKNTSSLSGGQQQRLSITRILTKKPKIIFADEPTGNLDKENALSVAEALFSYVKTNNSLLIFVTHDKNLAQKADKAYCLEDAKLEALKV